MGKKQWEKMLELKEENVKLKEKNAKLKDPVKRANKILWGDDDDE